MRQTEDNRQWLVISDLDGTLLNHHDYQYQAALPAIDQLKSKQIPVILNTSKTYPETLKIQKLLGIEAPFIVENGSCLFLPQSQFPEKPDSNARQREHFWEIVLGNTLEQIDATLEKLAIENNAYLRLSKCSPAEVARLTGLTESQAKDAIAREFSEPVIWNKSGHELESFKQLLQQQNLKTLQGGRFLHILGACDKGTAIDELAKYYPQPVNTVVLGDSANDADMLIHADIAVVVKSPGNGQLMLHITPPYITNKQAPEGWAEGINFALNKIQAEESR